MTKLTSEHDVVVSYNREDRAIVEDLICQLNNEGIRTWWDRNDISPGQEWPRQLESALSTTTAIAVLLGPHGLGEYQEKEILKVEENPQITIIPVILQGGPDALPLALIKLQYTDLRSLDRFEYEREFRRLIAPLKASCRAGRLKRSSLKSN